MCAAQEVTDAFELFGQHVDVLSNWRILYACNDDRGSIKLMKSAFGKQGIFSSALRGRSVIVLDKEFVGSSAPVRYEIGIGVYADSNVASYIRRASYASVETAELMNFTADIRAVLGVEHLCNLNPYYYMWECQRNWNNKTKVACRETVAAMLALHQDSDPLGRGWSSRYIDRYRDCCEAQAQVMIDEFLTDELREETGRRLLLIEAMILRTKLIDAASKKSPAYKLEALFRFMCEDLKVVMIRELVICSDILFKGNAGLTKKLNSLQTRKNPLGILQGCAWDVFMLRAMDEMVAAKGLPVGQAYIPYLASMDEDLSSIIQSTALKSIAFCRSTGRAFPFVDIALEPWLRERLGEERMIALHSLFSPHAFQQRAEGRGWDRVKEIVRLDRQRLLAVAE